MQVFERSSSHHNEGDPKSRSELIMPIIVTDGGEEERESVQDLVKIYVGEHASRFLN